MAIRTRAKLSVVGRGELIIKKQAIPYTIKRSARAKRIRLEISMNSGLTVIISRFYKIEQVPKLFERKARWVSRKLIEFGQVKSPSPQKELKSGDLVPYLGNNLKLIIGKRQENYDSVELEQESLVLNVREKGVLNLLLEKWYRKRAFEWIRERLEKLSSTLGLSCNHISIRGQRTRWASCSGKKNLSFNWRLIMAPEPVIDYVIIHELMHLKEKNHSEKFWKIVAENCPRWKEHKKWLKEVGIRKLDFKISNESYN